MRINDRIAKRGQGEHYAILATILEELRSVDDHKRWNARLSDHKTHSIIHFFRSEKQPRGGVVMKPAFTLTVLEGKLIALGVGSAVETTWDLCDPDCFDQLLQWIKTVTGERS